MQNWRIAPRLDRILQHDIQPEHRAAVIHALISEPKVQGRWLGDDGSGCFWAIATMAMGDTRDRLVTDPIGTTMRRFNVTEDEVVAAYQEWDGLSGRRLRQFISNLRRQVAEYEGAGQQEEDSIATRRLREYVGA